MSSVLASSDRFGSQVDLTKDGKILAVSAARDDGYGVDNTDDIGAVHLFTFTDSNFSSPRYEATIGKNYT